MAATLFKERTPREMQTPGRVADSALNKYFSRKRTPFSPIEYHSRSNYHKYSSKHAGIAKIHQLQHSELGCRIQNKLIDSNTTAQQHGFGLLIWNKSQNSQRNDNDSDEKSLHLQSCDMNSKHCSNYAKKREDSTQVIKKKAPYSISNPSLILLVATIVCIHHASFCTSFSDFERNLDTGLSQLDYPFAPPIQRSYLTSQNHGTRPNWLRQSRSFPSQPEFDEPLPGIMSSTARSFSQDESASTPPLPANSWTSIFTNPFGTNSNSNNISGDTLDQHIKAILVPRVSGTQGNTQVRQYIADNLRKNDYRVEFDEFTASTPIGNVHFSNIIADSNPEACRQLVLACHYDSKLMDGFLGATDSAVPCAMLLRISETFDKSKFPSDLGLRFIFFDGEEAFDQWTSTDSLYGSRHLAAKWEKQQIPAQCKTKGQNELERIELFVLLDLIGTADTTFVMYNKRLKNHYEALQSYEKAHMLRNGHTQLQARLNMAFKGRQMSMTFVEDDHVPFKKRGVPILLLLAHPFPSVWHTTDDDYSRIDFPKTRRILYALEQFVSNYSKDKV